MDEDTDNPGTEHLREVFARAWLTTVVSRVCTDMLRARALDRCGSPRADRSDAGGLDAAVRDPELDGDFAPGDSPASAAEASALAIAVLVALDHLRPEERMPFVLYDLMAVRGEDIAQALNCPVETARSLADRARARIQG